VLGEAWSRLPPLDPKAEERRRLRQMVYLSHYASEPMLSWEDRTVWELQDAYMAVNDLIKLENGER
jgi:hypothetical protein